MVSTNKTLNILLVLIPTQLLLLSSVCEGNDSYENVDALMKALFETNYNPQLRPLSNQSSTLVVDVSFALMSVVEIDDVEQTFKLNGFLQLKWKDQRLTWDPDKYGGVHFLTPLPKSIWRPRMLYYNTIGDRDPFKDNYDPLTVDNNGTVRWKPGALFQGVCALNMEKYPFDQQWCYIRMCPMSYFDDQLDFHLTRKDFDLDVYWPSEGWDLTLTKASIVILSTGIDVNKNYMCPNFSFQLKRKPIFFILNILLPIVVLSFLNVLVYVIPTDSGEKISYAITVLLALSVFLSTVSDMVPSASDSIPLITIYLFVLLMTSVVAVLASMAIVYLHNMDSDDEEESQPSEGKGSLPWTLFQRKTSTASSITPLESTKYSGKVSPVGVRPAIPEDVPKIAEYKDERPTKKYVMLSQSINRICLVISILGFIFINGLFLGLIKSED